MATKTPATEWQEPEDQAKKSGLGKWGRPSQPYDLFMDEQGIPIFRGIGVNKVQDLTLAPWKRMGGNGTFIQLWGTEGKWGMYVVEIPPAGALNTSTRRSTWLSRAGARPRSGATAPTRRAPSSGRRARCSQYP